MCPLSLPSALSSEFNNLVVVAGAATYARSSGNSSGGNPFPGLMPDERYVSKTNTLASEIEGLDPAAVHLFPPGELCGSTGYASPVTLNAGSNCGSGVTLAAPAQRIFTTGGFVPNLPRVRARKDST